MALLFMLLGLGAMLAFADAGSNSNFSSNDDDDDTPGDNPSETDTPIEPVGPLPSDVPPSVEPPAESVQLPGSLIAPGLSQVTGFSDNITFFLSNEYSGQDRFAAGEGFNTVNLSLFSGDLDVTVQPGTNFLITSPGNDTFAPVFYNIEQVILGDGANSFDASRAIGTFGAVSHGGENTLIGGQGTNYLASLGGNALIQGGGGTNYLSAAMGNDTIMGGDGPNFINAFNSGFVAVAGPGGEFLVLENVPGVTTITDGPGDDRIVAGRGDQITLTGGANHIEITGYAPANFGPAIINGFDPASDSFEFRVAISEIEEDYGTENPAPRDVTLVERAGNLVIVQSGIEMVRFTGLTLADVESMAEGRFIQQGAPNMGAYT